MDLKKFLLLISILLTLFLLLLSQKYTNQVTIEGKIKSISISKYTSIYLENNSTNILIFSPVNLKESQIIRVKGRLEKYQNKTQLLADKIICLN